MDHNKVDIIVPVYNALDDLKKCVDSVCLHTDLKKNRLILINDKSPDSKVCSYLNSINNSGIIVLENDYNMGFSATINRGISQSADRDVILLNSDAIVTPHWLEKIQDCAYSREEIGTVTPMSNNATICSVPYSNKDNRWPEEMTLDEYAEELERVSMYLYSELPVAMGFCMFIKRKVISEVGMFDSETFGRGYGEENDFCNRASEVGYTHVLCDSAFVYHKGTASFKESSKQKLIEEHEAILKKRYPQLMVELDHYLQSRQNGKVHKNVELYTKLNLNNSKKNILYLIQADFQDGCSNNIGGTQLHVKDLVNGLCDEYNLFVAARDGAYLNVTQYRNNEQSCKMRFYIGLNPVFPQYRNERLKTIYENLLAAFQIDLVHVQHTMGMSLEIFYVAEKMQIPVYMTLHDYYFVCPTLRLLNTKRESCVGINDIEECKKCLNSEMGIYDKIDFISKWRAEHSKVLALCDKIIIPSQSAADILLKYFPEIEHKVQIIPHGINAQMFRKIDNHRTEHNKLHVAFVGGLCETKGSKVVYDMIASNKDKFKWFIFGGVDGKGLSHLSGKSIVKTGWYKRDELQDLLDRHEIDVVCNLSIVAETFCYTLSEVIACGVPTIVTDIGALGERMRNMKCGWIVPQNATAEVVIRKLDEIQNDLKEYDQIRTRTGLYHVKTIDEMVNSYRQLYKAIEKNKKSHKADYAMILEGYMDAVGNLEGASSDLERRNQFLEKELKTITSSNIYRYMVRIAGMVDRIKGR